MRVAALVVVVACAKSSANGPTLALAELKAYAGVELAAQLHPDGRFDAIAGGKLQHVLTFAADGAIMSVTDGTSAHLEPDGTLVGPDGTTVPGFKLDGAALLIDSSRVTIGNDGSVLFDGAPYSPPLRFEGATDVKLQRTALVVFALMMEARPHAARGAAPAPR